MFTAKFIKNVIFDGERLRAIGRSGRPTRVFAEQGDLDGSCAVYSLLMMLIFHKKLDWEDLTDRGCAKDNDFVDRIQRLFLYSFKSLCRGGHIFDDLSSKLNVCFGEKLSEVFTTTPERFNSVSRRELHEKIRAQLDVRRPVLLGFKRNSEKGHALVAIAYKRESKSRLRLFCLDPGRMLPFMQIWNNVIDLDYLSPDNKTTTDINHYENDKVCVDTILIIHDNPLIQDTHFDKKI